MLVLWTISNVLIEIIDVHVTKVLTHCRDININL